MNHLLLYCSFAWRVWSHMLSWWDFQGAFPETIDSLLLWWDGVRLNKREKKIWRAIPPIVLWSLWKYRNDCVFNDTSPNLSKLCELVKIRIAIWLKSVLKEYHLLVQDFISNLKGIRHCLEGKRLQSLGG